MSNFKIGQKVVYVGVDQIYPRGPRVIIGLKKGCCVDLLIDTGVSHQLGSCCPECVISHSDTIVWKASFLFRPLLDTFAEETLSKAKSDADEILEIMGTLQEAVK